MSVATAPSPLVVSSPYSTLYGTPCSALNVSDDHIDDASPPARHFLDECSQYLTGSSNAHCCDENIPLAVPRVPHDPAVVIHDGARSRSRIRATLSRLFRSFRRHSRAAPAATSVSAPTSISAIEQSIATFRTTSFKRYRSRRIDPLDETWEDWLEQYQRCGNNLSDLSRPTCFCGFGHMAAPDHFQEGARLRALAKINDTRMWRAERAWIHEQIRPILNKYHIKSATVSVIEKTTQQVLYSTGMGGTSIPTIGRELSLDAHTILSAGFFALLDASSDWRTRLNPLVHGPPFIRFYLGVPLIVEGLPVGCLAVFDPYLKPSVCAELIGELTHTSQTIVDRITAKMNLLNSSAGRSRIQWAEDASSIITALSDLSDEGDISSSISFMSRTDTVAASTGDDESNCATPIFLSGMLSADEAADVGEDSCSHMMPTDDGAEDVHPAMMPDVSLHGRLQPLVGRTILQPYEVFESLLRCRSVHQAIKKACRIVQQNLGIDLVYVAETRIHHEIDVKAEILKHHRSGDSYNFESPTHGSGSEVDNFTWGESESAVRVVGYTAVDRGPAVVQQILQHTKLHELTINSSYGVRYIAEDGLLCSGLLMPFRRTAKRLFCERHRQKPFLQPQPRLNHTQTQATGSNAHVRYGGFILGAFTPTSHVFSPGDVVFMKKVAKALQNILECHDEIVSTRSHTQT